MAMRFFAIRRTTLYSALSAQWVVLSAAIAKSRMGNALVCTPGDVFVCMRRQPSAASPTVLCRSTADTLERG